MRSVPKSCAAAVFVLLNAPGLGGAQVGPSASVTLPETIPVFPLPDVTLFPNSTQPFHIFEPRYRAMVADALEGDSIIGMVLLRPGYEDDYEGRPPVYDIGCAGTIIASEELPDGRYNIVLSGLTKFRILSEDATRSYRLAVVEELPEVIDPSDRPLLTRRRQELEEALSSAYPDAQSLPPGLSDAEVVDGLSLMLPLEPAQRLELLEAEGPVRRAAILLRLLRGGARAQP